MALAKDVLRDIQLKKVLDGLASLELQGGRGLNQETTLKRASD